MAKRITYVCNNCGEPFVLGPDYTGAFASKTDRHGWFTNKYAEECHYCEGESAGTIGEMVESDDYIPKAASVIERLPSCPCCGKPVVVASKDQYEHFVSAGGGVAPGYVFICPRCMIMFSDASPEDYYLGSIDLEVEKFQGDARIMRHIDWVRSLSGYNFKNSATSKLLGISEDYMGGIVRGRSRSGKIKVVCGSCGSEMTATRQSSSDNELCFRGYIPLLWPQVAYAMKCQNTACKREDYYYRDPKRNKWTWCGMDFDRHGAHGGSQQYPSFPTFYEASQNVPPQTQAIEPIPDFSELRPTPAGPEYWIKGMGESGNMIMDAKDAIALKAAEMGIPREAFLKLAQKAILKAKEKRKPKMTKAEWAERIKNTPAQKHKREIAEIAKKIKALVED